jgi:glycine oxidase
LHERDVVVIGGGVIGCSIAYYLAKRGARVTVLERDLIGSHSSSAAAGILGAQVEMAEPGPLSELCVKSRSMFPDLASELYRLTGIDIELIRTGVLRIAWTREEAEALYKRGVWQRERGGTADWWDRDRVRSVEPAVSDRIEGALYIPGDSHVSSSRLTRAFSYAAELLGAELIERCEVTALRAGKDRIERVESDRGTFQAEHVVLAAGAWSAALAGKLGLRLPVVPVKGESLAVYPRRALFERTLFAEGCYLVPKADGKVIVGATERAGDFTEWVTMDAIQKLTSEAVRLVPELADSTFIRAWSSVRPGSVDGLPFIGKFEPYRNLFVATGHFRNGILLSPVTGQGIAEMIAGEEVPDLKPFSPNRLSQP